MKYMKATIVFIVLVGVFLTGQRYYEKGYLFPPMLQVSEEGFGKTSERAFDVIRPSAANTPNIILLSIDTLRADHLGIYGHTREVSPAVDTFAADAVVFENAIVSMPKTSPALFSLLTGLHPKTHGVVTLGRVLSREIKLLPEYLREFGYQNVGVCGQHNCHSRYGFGRGFDLYDDDFQLSDEEPSAEDTGFRSHSERRAEYIVDRGISSIEKAREAGKPFFAWLHFMDPHAGYTPPAPYLEKFSGTSQFSGNSILGQEIPLASIQKKAVLENRTDYDFYLNRYDGEIRYLDDQLARLFDFLKKQGLYEDALIILTADHGEYMGESSARYLYFDHGSSVHESEVRVPLIVKLPGAEHANTRQNCVVSINDILPTTMSFLGKPMPPHEGQDLLPLFGRSGVTGCERSRVYVQRQFTLAHFGVRDDRYKLVVGTEHKLEELRQLLQSGEAVPFSFELYDLMSDPLEREDVSRSQMQRVRVLSGELADWLVSSPYAANRVFAAKQHLDEDTLEHLEALGYLQ